MADLPPRYAYRVGRGEPDAWDERPDERVVTAPELATRRWMLVAVGLAAAVLVVALLSVMAFSRGAEKPSGASPAQVNDVAAPAGATTSIAAQAASGAGSGTTTNAADARQLADARAGIAATEAQLKSMQERADDLDRRLAAAEQLNGITTRRAEAAEAATAEQETARAQMQRDLDAINADLTQANADRAALRVQLQDAQGQAAAGRAQAAASQAQASSLAATADALRSCLEVHKQALYYTTLDNWGLLAVAMQGVAADCAAELG